MELYEENEHIISSDEYSDDDALMNDAVTAKDHNRSRNYSDQNQQPKWTIDQKHKELSSLIRRNKIAVIYKNKAIKWLNNRWHRERYKERIYIKSKNTSIDETNSNNIASLEQQKQLNNKSGTHKYNKEGNDNLLSHHPKNKEIIDTNNVSSTSAQVKDSEQENGGRKADEKITIPEKNINDIQKFLEKVETIPGKRTRTASTPILNESTESDIMHHDKKFRAASTDFYRSINDMFPKFENIATNHIDNIASTLLTVVEDKIKELSNEINTLNEVLQTKEMEWNRLSHLKMVKEEIHSRLKKKRYILQLKESFSNKQDQNILLELKELEFYLSEVKETADTSNSSITIKKLIEKRANMNADDLKREKNNTSRLHSLLVSQNMLHSAESSENHYTISNGEKKDLELKRKKSEAYDQLKEGTANRAQAYNRDRQGEVRDVESLIVDFRQKNPKLLPLVGKHKPTESTAKHQGYSIPSFGKTSRSQLFIKDHQPEFYSLPNSIDEISITPIGRSKKIPASHDFANKMNNHYDARLADILLKRQAQRDLNGESPTNLKNPLCQECTIKESRFVCAGCGNQWYCSKKCQISAWDKHSELCTE